MTGIDKDQLSRQVEAFTAWKQAIAREISRYRGWLNNQGLNNREVGLCRRVFTRQVRAH